MMNIFKLSLISFLLIAPFAHADMEEPSHTAEVRSYSQQVQEKVYHTLLDDEIKWRGSALFQLTIKNNGDLDGVDILRSTGMPEIDKHIMFEIYAIGNFGAFSEGLKNEGHLTLEIEVSGSNK